MMMTTRAKRLIGACLLGLTLIPWQGTEQAVGQPPAVAPGGAVSPPPVEFEEAGEILLAWLECEECYAGQLEAVVRLGTRAVPTLATALKDGPSTVAKAELRRHLTLNYETASKTGKKRRMTQTEYIDTYLDSYTSQYRIRAARALGAIGGPEAKGALEEALKASLPKQVETEIWRALASAQPASP